MLLAVELAQGAIGFAQYFTGLPVVLVGFHLLGAALLTAVAGWLWLATEAAAAPAPPGPSGRTSAPATLPPEHTRSAG